MRCSAVESQKLYVHSIWTTCARRKAFVYIENYEKAEHKNVFSYE